MTIVIHHGANGSYKSSGVVQDYLIPAIKQGRKVVTNLEGCTLDVVHEVMGDDVHENFDIINVDADTVDGKQLLLRWFHWVPVGSLLIFDEAGKVFPKSLRQTDIDKLNYLTPDQAKQNGRPHKWLDAFQEHRKYNWDIVLSAPNITAIRRDIRETTEGAYKHSNMAKMSGILRGWYKEGYHDANATGSASTITVVNTKQIKDKRAFKLYKSTKTGIVKDTIAGKSLFTSIPLLGALAVCIAAIAFAFTNGGLEVFSREPIQPTENDSEQIPVNSEQIPSNPVLPSQTISSSDRNGTQDVIADPSNPISDVVVKNSVHHDILSEWTGRLVSFNNIGGQLSAHAVFEKTGYQPITLHTKQLTQMGYIVSPLTYCNLQIENSEIVIRLTCSPEQRLISVEQPL